MSNESTIIHSELSLADIIAGGVLVLYGIIALTISVTVATAIYSLAKKMNGFVLIFSEAIANILLIFQFGVLTGGIVLINIDPFTSFRWIVVTLCDFCWFAMAQHPLVACTRFAAIKWPMEFKQMNAKKFVFVSVFFWCFAMVQSVCLHLTSWFALFYFDPSVAYGMTTDDFEFYGNNGTKHFWDAYNGFTIITSLLLYGVTLIILFKQNKSVTPAQDTKKKQSRSLSVEKRLLIPCAINTVCYLMGQIAFRMSNFGGKWGGWFYSFVFLTKSFVTPIILVGFSKVVWNRTLEIIKLKEPEQIRTIMSYNARTNSKIGSEAGTPRSSPMDRRRSSARDLENALEIK